MMDSFRDRFYNRKWISILMICCSDSKPCVMLRDDSDWMNPGVSLGKAWHYTHSSIYYKCTQVGQCNEIDIVMHNVTIFFSCYGFSCIFTVCQLWLTSQLSGEGEDWHTFPTKHMKPNSTSFQTAAHPTSQGSRTHVEESGISPLMHTQPHRHPWLISIALIDNGESTPSLPENMAKFAFENSSIIRIAGIIKSSKSRSELLPTHGKTFYNNSFIVPPFLHLKCVAAWEKPFN